ncbi:MAG: type I-D CRISPR-associated protein Cas7/Csc2 [Promethearchaeota archaeon]
MVLEKYKENFVESHSHKMNARYITIFLLRMLESEAIFRTDEINCNEITKAGMERNDNPGEFIRIFMSMRKAIAPERREGRKLLRRYGILGPNNSCKINEKMCGECIDCQIYGTAVGTNVSLKSHVMTEESFSILPYDRITTEHTFNALYENGTMVNAEGKHSQSIQKNEVIKPGAIFLDIETIGDVTIDEFKYIFANILRTKRYGAISTRIGKVTNKVIGLVFSNCELFSNLEWTQYTYDLICKELKLDDGVIPEFPIDPKIAEKCAKSAMNELLKITPGKHLALPDDEIDKIIQEIKTLYEEETQLKNFLTKIDKDLKQK